MRDEMLLAYFDRLIEADKSGYMCHREISEVIDEIRGELGLSQPCVEVNEEELVDYISNKIGPNIDKTVIDGVLQLEVEFLKIKGVIVSN
jgi:hypothetical protein